MASFSLIHTIYLRATAVGQFLLQTKKAPTVLLELSVKGLGTSAVRKAMLFTPTSLLSSHGLSFGSRRTGEWLHAASISLLFQLKVLSAQKTLCRKYFRQIEITLAIFQVYLWSLRLLLVFFFWEANQARESCLLLRHLDLRIVQFPLFLRLVTTLALSSLPIKRHS